MSVENCGVDVASLNLLRKEIQNINEKMNEIIFKNRGLKKEIIELTVENNNLYDSLYDIEILLNNLDQYSRRSKREIRNISENINQFNLEKCVLKVLDSIDIKLQSYDLVAVHRIGKFISGKNRSVIVRFINRKNAYYCLRNSKKLAGSSNHEYKKLFIIENLCYSNKKIFNYLYRLKKENKIRSAWSYNGSVFYRMSDEIAVRAYHIDDIVSNFDSESDHGL